MTNSASDGPRVLFVGRTIAHLSYYDSVIAALLARGAQVTLLFDEEWSSRWPGGEAALDAFRAAHPTLQTGWSLRRSDERRDRIFALRELRTYRSYLVRSHTSPFYVERWFDCMTHFFRKKLGKRRFVAWLRKPIIGRWLEREERRTPPDAGIVEDLRQRAPQAVVASPINMRTSEEVEYLKAAHALGIPTAVPVLSWDNLSTKGLLHVLPTRLFVWNEDQRADALEIHGADPARVEMAGAPFFDKWFDAGADLPSREAFCAKVGLDPAAPILLYLGSSKNISGDEAWFLRDLRAAMAASSDAAVRRCQLLVRPHPGNAKAYGALDEPGLAVWPKNGALPETAEAFSDLRASFAHAEAAIGINTSGMIDSVLADRATFSVLLPQYADTQTNAPHFRYLAGAEALTVCADLGAFVSALSGLMEGRDPTAGARRAFGQSFARPQGAERSAGDVVAEGVLKLIG